MMQKVSFNGIESATGFKQNSKNITDTIKEEPSKEADFESYDKAVASNAKAGIAFKGKFFKNWSSFEQLSELASKTANGLSKTGAAKGEMAETVIKQESKTITKQVIDDVKNEGEAVVKPIVDGAKKAEEKIEEKAKTLFEDLLNIGERPLTKPLLFKEQNETPLFYNLSNPKPMFKREMAPPELKAVLAEINKDALEARELASKFMDEIVHSPEYLQKRQALLDIYQNKKYAGVIEEYQLELYKYPKEMTEAFKNGQREFTNVPGYGTGLVRVVPDKEVEELTTGSMLVNNGKIKLDYTLSYDGNIGYVSCNNTTQPILTKHQAPNMFFEMTPDGKRFDRVTTICRKNNDFCGGVTYEYGDNIPNYCVKKVTKDLPDNYSEAIKFQTYGEVHIGLPGIIM